MISRRPAQSANPLPTTPILVRAALLLGFLLLGPATAAAGVFTLPSLEPRDSYNLGRHLEVLKDPGRRLTIQEVAASGRFSPAGRYALNYGFSGAAYWVRLTLRNPEPVAEKILLEVGYPRIDRVDLYAPRSGGGWERRRAGETIPFDRREVRYRNPVFPLDLAPGDTTLYFRYQDAGSVTFSLTLWQPDAFPAAAAQRQFRLGLYYGGMLVILFCSLILYLMLRNRNYFHYVVYVAGYLFWQFTANGLAGEYLWPGNPALANRLIPILACLSCILALRFTAVFLKTAANVPKLHRLLYRLQFAFAVLVPFALLPRYSQPVLPMVAFLAIILSPLILLAGLRSWQRGYRPARYFTIAWTFLLCGTALLALKSFGLLPSTFLTEHGQQLGSVFEIALLSLALADQVLVMRQEKAAAQERALRIQQEATTRLEEQVAVRTRKLREVNTTLEDISTRLAKYLSPQVYASLFSGRTDPDRRSARRRLTVFFSDIQEFTALSDGMEPEALTVLLNDYLNEMAAIALHYGGTIDKYIGDAVMIFFGDPESKGEKEDAGACIMMALDMQKRIRALRRKWAAHGGNRPLRVRMGVNTGYCTVGNFGSDYRLDYTIIGSPVILAHRLETAAEPDRILISHATYSLVKDRIVCEPLGRIRVKGFAEPVSTYMVLHPKSEQETGEEPIRAEEAGFAITLEPGRMPAAARRRAARTLQLALARLNDAGAGEPGSK